MAMTDQAKKDPGQKLSYDLSINARRTTWIGLYRRIVQPFIARPVGEEIFLEGSFKKGELI